MNFSKLENENCDLRNRLEINEKSKIELGRKYTKCLDRIYDLEKELDKANQQILIKNERLIGMREAANKIFGQFSDLRSDITSARRAQDRATNVVNENRDRSSQRIPFLEYSIILYKSISTFMLIFVSS